MNVITTPLPGVLLLEPAVHADARGWFSESFNAPRFADVLATHGCRPAPAFVQDNQSSSRRGVLRGLHYQLPPHEQGKLVRVARGAAWDVAVDIRRGSPTFGRWFGTELSADNHRQLWIPPGFAHGFLALHDDTLLLYKVTDVYDRGCDRAVRFDDPTLGVAWPGVGVDGGPLVSAKDAQAPLLGQAELPAYDPPPVD